MATTDPRYIIKNIVETYITANPITKDNDVAIAKTLHLYERGPEDIKGLFYTEDYDVVFFYGEPRVNPIRKVTGVPVHFLMSYPVTVVSVDKHNPVLGVLVCTATEIQAKARTALRAAVAASAQSAAGATPAYELIITQETGKNEWSAGLNLWSTPYILNYTTGGP